MKNISDFNVIVSVRKRTYKKSGKNFDENFSGKTVFHPTEAAMFIANVIAPNKITVTLAEQPERPKGFPVLIQFRSQSTFTSKNSFFDLLVTIHGTASAGMLKTFEILRDDYDLINYPEKDDKDELTIKWTEEDEKFERAISAAFGKAA